MNIKKLYILEDRGVLFIQGSDVKEFLYGGIALLVVNILSILIPSILIIIFNIKAGRLIYRNPVVGIVSVLPAAIFIYRGSKPLVFGINNWIDRKRNEFIDSKEVVDAEVVSKEEA